MNAKQQKDAKNLSAKQRYHASKRIQQAARDAGWTAVREGTKDNWEIVESFLNGTCICRFGGGKSKTFWHPAASVLTLTEKNEVAEWTINGYPLIRNITTRHPCDEATKKLLAKIKELEDERKGV